MSDKQIDRISESLRERESNEVDRQTEKQLCQTDKQTDRSSEPMSETDNENRQTNEHTEKCDREKDRDTQKMSMCTNNNNDLFIGAAASLMQQQKDEPVAEDKCARSRGGEGAGNAQIHVGGTRWSDGQGLLEVRRRRWISSGVKHRWKHREMCRTRGCCSSPSCHGGMLQRTKRGCWSGMMRSRCGTSSSHHGGMLQVWVMTDPDKRPFSQDQIENASFDRLPGVRRERPLR